MHDVYYTIFWEKVNYLWEGRENIYVKFKVISRKSAVIYVKLKEPSCIKHAVYTEGKSMMGKRRRETGGTPCIFAKIVIQYRKAMKRRNV